MGKAKSMDKKSKVSQDIMYVKVTDIERNPLNPRTVTAKSPGVPELADAIKHNGLDSPIMVVPNDPKESKVPYRIVFGERRFVAAKLAGFKEISVTVMMI